MRGGGRGSRRGTWWDFEHGKAACDCLIVYLTGQTYKHDMIFNSQVVSKVLRSVLAS